MWFLRRLLPFLLIPALAWGQALHQEKVGLYNANKAGDDCSQATIALADTQALALGQVLLLPPTDRFGNACQWSVSSNLTIESPVLFPYDSTPVLKVEPGTTLTLDACPLVWGDYFILDANGSTSGTVIYTQGCTQCNVSGVDNWTKCTIAGGDGGGGGGSGPTTEAQLETVLTDVADVFTDNDGALTDDDLTNNLIADLQDVDPNATGTLGQILLGEGSGYVAVTWPSCNLTTEKVHFDPDVASLSCVPDGGGGGGGGTLDQAFDAGTGEIDSALIGTKPLKLLGVAAADDFIELGVDAGGIPKIIATCNGTGCDNVLGIAPDRNFILHDSEAVLDMWTIDPDATTRHAVYQIHNGYQFLDSVEWTAWSMWGDGTECDTDPSGTPPTQGIACPMVAAEQDGRIDGAPITLPGDFDKTADVTFSIKAYLTTDSGAGTWHGHIKIDCVGPGETPGTYTPAVGIGLDLTPAVEDVVGDEIHDVAAAVIDTDTTGADCDPGDTLYWRWNACTTDATPSSGCTSSAGFENDMSVFSVRMEYKKNSLSE